LVEPSFLDLRNFFFDFFFAAMVFLLVGGDDSNWAIGGAGLNASSRRPAPTSVPQITLWRAAWQAK
jgi:hypothetical protein